MKQKLLFFLKMTIALGLIFWLVKSERLDFSVLSSLISPQYLLPGFILVGFGIAVATERWRQLMLSQDIQISYSKTGKLVLIGTFFNYFMPGGVGGDFIKAFYIAKEFPNSKTKVIISVLMDRVIGLFSMVLLAIFIMLSNWSSVSQIPQLKFILSILWFILAAFMLFWLIVFNPKINKHPGLLKFVEKLPGSKSMIKIIHSLSSYGRAPMAFATSLGLSLVAQLSSVCFFYVAGLGLGFHEVSFTTYLFVVPIGFMIQAIPIAPAGIGIGQAAFLFLFNAAAQTDSVLGPSTITAFQITTFCYGLIGAFCYLRMSKSILRSPIQENS